MHETPGFDENIRALVRSSPWWMISAVVHLLVLAVLSQVRWEATRASVGETLIAEIPEEDLLPEDFDIPEATLSHPETIVETVLPVEDDPVEPEDDTDDPEHDTTSGEDGLSSGPFMTGPFMNDGWNTAIGPGGGAGGGTGPGGNKRRRKIVGSSERTLPQLELGLKWLADHQDVEGDGRWDCDGFMKHDPADDKCDGPGGALYDVGVTGLALLAFLGAGYTDRGSTHENPYSRNVRQGLRYLMTAQDEEGCFGTRASQHFMYNHAIAALAVCEAYWMTRNPRYKKAAQEALNFICRARNPYLAWRYEPRAGENDTSVTGWMIMALKSGKYGGLEIDPDAFEGARTWIDKMTDPDFGQVGYNMPGGTSARPEGMQDRFPPEKTQSMTSVGILTRIFLGEDPRNSGMIRKGADLCLEHPPRWDPEAGTIDMYYWYYATLALFQVGGKHWESWNRAMTDAIVKHQWPEKSGSRTGSWDPIGPWGPDGGRVYSTACMVLCLEVYYRYDRVFGTRNR
jgi:hypothetical protein